MVGSRLARTCQSRATSSRKHDGENDTLHDALSFHSYHLDIGRGHWHCYREEGHECVIEA
jgi:hypothetical protein